MKKYFLITITIFTIVFAWCSCKSKEENIPTVAVQKETYLKNTKETVGKAPKTKPKEIEKSVGTTKTEVVKQTKEDNQVNMEVKEEETLEQKETSTFVESDLELLARVIWAEAGSDWLTDEHQRAVASVVINRVNDSRFPNTIRDVIYQPGQYGCVNNGMIHRTPNQRAYDNARYVLENGVTIPSNVVWQAQSMQGNGLYKYIQGHYFCY